MNDGGMTALICAVFVPLVFFGAWIYGEVANNRPMRVIGAVACILSCTVVASGISGISAAFSVGIPLGEAFHAYVDAAGDQIETGNTEFVVEQFEEFKERVPVTYESGAFVRDLKSATQRMASGPRGNDAPALTPN